MPWGQISTLTVAVNVDREKDIYMYCASAGMPEGEKNWGFMPHPGQDWFIIHVKLGHSMDNGFIFKKINKIKM